MNYSKIFGNNVRRVRENKRITLSKLAKMTKYNRQALSKVENGEQNIGFNNAVKIAKVLDVHFPLLFSSDFDLNNYERYLEDNYLLIFTDNIRLLLEMKSKFQNSIYPELGMDPGYFNRIINHKTVPKLNTVIAISKFLKIELKDLLRRGGI